MKKLLALVLALVMTLSLCVTSNAAYAGEEFDYDEAVEVMSAIGVFQGDQNGKFNPKGILTREQAAKIVTYMLLGKKSADALVTIAAPFADVAADRWSAGSIAYCYNEGILAGVGEGKFAPTAELTGLAFAKMMLTALGYDAEVEGLVGANWSINAAKLALTVGLTKGLDNVALSQPMTREQAAKMALNTLEATMVEYPNASVVKVGDVEVTTSAKASAVANTATVEKIDNDNEMQFAEKYFTNLKKSGAVDTFSRPATKWMLKSETIGTYADAADLTYTTEVKTGTIYSDLGLDKGIAAAKSTVYEDGNKNNIWSGYDIVRAGTNKIGGQGALTEVYYDADAGTATIVVINTYAGKVDAVYKATAAKDAYVNVAPLNSKTGTFETEDYAIDDIVLFTYSDKDAKIVDLKKAEIVTGTLSGYTATTSVVVDGTTYKANKVYKSTVTDGNFSSYKTYEVDLVMDNYGNIQYVDTSKAATNYAVVVNYKTTAGTYGDTTIAQLLFTDGTTKDVTIKNLYDATGANTATFDDDSTWAAHEIDKGDIVRFTVDSKDKYSLYLLADVDATNVKGDDTDPMAIVTKGQSTIALKENTSNTNYGTYAGTARAANGKTTFLVAKKNGNGNDTVYTAYKGIANVPTIKSAVAAATPTPVTVYAKTAGIATLVYIDLTRYGTAASANKDVVFVKASSGASASYDSVIGTYYNYTVIKNGEVVENFKVRNSDITGYTLYTSVSYDDDGVATLEGKVTTETYSTILTNKAGIAVTNDGTVQAANDVIGLGNYYYSYNSNSKVFFIDADGEVSTSSISAIGTDADDDAYFTLNDDGEIQYLFVVQNGVGTGSVSSSYSVTTALTATEVTYASSKLTVNLSNLGLKKGAVVTIADLTLTADAYARDTNQNWVKVATDSNTDVDFTAGNSSSTTDITSLGLTTGSYRITLTLSGGDVGTLNLGTFTVAVA